MARTGRPRANIDQTQFEQLCKLQCTKTEMASWFNVDEDTINNWCKRTYGETFSAVYQKKAGAGKISMRRNMLKLAEKNASVAIFLAKNYLGMSDKQEVEITHNDETTQAMDEFFAAKKAQEKTNG